MIRRAVAVALLAATALLTACGGEEDERPLRSLRADPLARYVPPGGKAVVRASNGQQTKNDLGKPTEARFERVYTVRDAEAFASAVAFAKDHGWVVDASGAAVGNAEVASLTRTVGTGRARATLTLLRSAVGLPDGARPPALSVVLTHALS